MENTLTILTSPVAPNLEDYTAFRGTDHEIAQFRIKRVHDNRYQFRRGKCGNSVRGNLSAASGYCWFWKHYRTAVAEKGMLDVRPVLTVSLSADHRATDGATGSRFLNGSK